MVPLMPCFAPIINIIFFVRVYNSIIFDELAHLCQSQLKTNEIMDEREKKSHPKNNVYRRRLCLSSARLSTFTIAGGTTHHMEYDKWDGVFVARGSAVLDDLNGLRKTDND